ncbi:hypothetical protein NE237_021348 [Protea cynaroides]|uniref:Uncharacterized protein n=1 Tax=Protea cynaroides TaxID=273540 RepID=A0A9Q0H8C0_9MAGN|nr:hypothetical protein NE237_021348 [Protea cynaroides]
MLSQRPIRSSDQNVVIKMTALATIGAGVLWSNDRDSNTKTTVSVSVSPQLRELAEEDSGEVGDGTKCCPGCFGRDSIANAASKVGLAVVNLSVREDFYGMPIGKITIGLGTLGVGRDPTIPLQVTHGGGWRCVMVRRKVERHMATQGGDLMQPNPTETKYGITGRMVHLRDLHEPQLLVFRGLLFRQYKFVENEMGSYVRRVDPG